MGRLFIVAVAMSLAVQQRANKDLGALTPPPSSPCRPTPAPVLHEGNRVLSGLWGNLAVKTNPWIGTDRIVITDVFERLFGQPRLADGPIMSRQEFANFRNQLAEDVEEGYVAFYDGAEGQVTVYALRIKPERPMPESNRRAPPNPEANWFTAKQVIGLIVGARGDCRDSLVTHIAGFGAVVQ